MKVLSHWLRCLPILLFAVLGGTALILCNPGYFWDDWVWIFQYPADNIRIGRELGIWWGGYVTNFINALPEPSLSMRIVALVGWLIAGAAFVRVMYRQRLVTRSEAFQLFLIFSSTQVALIRFLTSVAFYNLYIAAFWLGCATLLSTRRSKFRVALSLPLFFFSFYLNSLQVLYALLLGALLLRDLLEKVEAPRFPQRLELVTRFRATGTALKQLALSCEPHAIVFIKREFVLIATPVVFILVKHFTTLKSPAYADYNSIDYRLLYTSISESFKLVWPVFKDFVTISKNSVPPLIMWGTILLCFILIKLSPRVVRASSPKTIAIQFVFGMFLFAAAIYPYLVVQKPPLLDDFYESRHIMPAIAGFDLVLLSLINACYLIFKFQPFFEKHGRDVLLSCLLGLSISSSFIVGTDLWRDWERQIAIMDFLQSHPDQLKDVRTFVFDDTSSGMHIGQRNIWNYEYTGDLISVYGGRDHFGVSMKEYRSWEKNVALLQKSFYRDRYNIRDYDFSKPHAIIYVKNGLVNLTLPNILRIAYLYLFHHQYDHDLSKYIDVKMAYEFIDTEQRVPELYRMADALAAYKLEHGYYPVASQQVPALPPTYNIESDDKTAPAATIGDVPGLFPKYMEPPASMGVHQFGKPTYIYFSDGVDYKLVYDNVRDYDYAKQAHPALIDPERRGYGVWTYGAANW